MSQWYECCSTNRFRSLMCITYLRVWMPPWDAADSNPGGLLAQSAHGLLQRGWSALVHHWAVWRFVLWYFCSLFLSLCTEFGDTFYPFWHPRLQWERGKTAELGGAWGRWGGRRLEVCFLADYFLHYLSVSLWPRCTSLLRSRCLSLTFST